MTPTGPEGVLVEGPPPTSGAGSVVLAIEAWYGGSHRRWVDDLRAVATLPIGLVALGARAWRWRSRAAAVPLAAGVARWVESFGRPDVVLVSGMVDVAALLGLARRSIGSVPVVLYLHENQLAYPTGGGGGVREADLDAAVRTWVSLEAADVVCVNSDHHRRVVADGLASLRGRVPAGEASALPDPALVDAACVIAPGVDLAPFLAVADRRRSPGGGPGDGHGGPDRTAPLVLWNHRWDRDKEPETFVVGCERLVAAGIDFRVVLAGDDDWDGGARRAVAAVRLGDVVVASGPFPAEEYRRWVAAADVVVSTAAHDFFGIAVVEAMAAGCVPVLPARCSYPEIVPASHHDAVLYAPGRFDEALATVVGDLGTARRRVEGLAGSMGRFDRSVTTPALEGVLRSTVARPGGAAR